MAPVYFNGVDVTKAYLNGRPVFLHFPGSGFDPDAQAYITAVEEADGQALESGVRTAINDFVVGCKADGIWNAIKASAILAGARTLNGALVPLVGTAPTNFNFVSDDYNRRTGLVGNGTSKYLDSNRNVNADPQNSVHQAVFITAAQTDTNTRALIGAGAIATGATQFNFAALTNTYEFRMRFGSPAFSSGNVAASGLIGQSRSGPTAWAVRITGATIARTEASETPFNGNALVFARNSATNVVGLWTNARLSFYSIGESLDLAQLDARMSTLMTALEFGINTGLPASNYDPDTVNYINRAYAAGGTLS
jgi:hypothetical protein